MAARPQASCPPLAPPSSVALLRRSSCGVWHFWSSSNAAVVVCALVCLLLLPSCNADKNEDLLAGLNNYRLSQNYTVLATSIGGQCFAEKLAAALKDTPCTNTSAQYSVDDANIAGASRSLQSCRISPENVQDAKILPVCVNDARVQSALVFYITSSQVEYQRYLNSSEYVSAGVGSAGPYFIVILGTAEATGNLAQTLSNGSPTNLLTVSLPLLFAALVAKLLLAGAY